MKTTLQKIITLAGLALFALLPACQRSTGVPQQPLVLLHSPTPGPQSTLTPTITPTPYPTPTPLPGARVESGDHALFNGDWEKALVEFQTALQASPDPSVQEAALLGIGRSWLMGRNYYEATETLQRLVSEYPESPLLADAFFQLALVYGVQEMYSDAAQAYTEYLKLRPGVIAAYVYDWRGQALFSNAEYSAAALDFQAALQAGSMLDENFLRMKLARSYALANDFPTALALYDDLYQRASDDPTRALISLRTGQLYASQGQTEQANAAYMEAVTNYPTTYDAYLALTELVNAGVAVDELQRGIIDYHARQYGVALAAFDRYLQNNPADPATAHYYYGLTHRALGEPEKAIQQWDKVIQEYASNPYWDEAWEEKAYTQWAILDDYPAAVQTLLDFNQQASGHPRAAEFIFDAAQIAEQDNRLDQAIELWERMASYYPNETRVPRAIFLAAIARYRQGEYDLALQTFQRYLGLAATPEDKTSAYFWIGKTQYALGEMDSARANWETLSGMDPTGYYSERARDILRERQPFAPPQSYDLTFDAAGEQAAAEAWLRRMFNLPAESDLSGLGALAFEAELQRGLELWRLGLYDEARAEFEQLRLKHQFDAAQSYRLSRFLAQLGAYRPAIMAARQVLDLAGMDDAQTLNAPAYFNHLRFGSYYNDLVMPLAQEYGFHPLFLYSVIRQESLFEGFVRSSAGARGLMQIIPATGEELAKSLGWPDDYIADDLYRPQVNLKFGVAYLDKQRQAFDGNLYAALAAYNGGPGNAQAWLKLAPDDPDLLLEIIRFPETRNYIRHIYEIFTIYRSIYDRTP